MVHNTLLHLLLVRDDMTQFQHLHPEYINGRWIVETTIPEQGEYQLYIDIAPKAEAPIVLRVPITVGRATVTRVFPTPTPDLRTSHQGITATLTTQGNFKINQTQSLIFSLTKDGQPVKDIRPYLGAFGHVVLLHHHEPNDFLHVHPVIETHPSDGKVAFETIFAAQGRYTLYAQFNVEGSIETFPITVDVIEEESGNTSSMDHTNHMKGMIDHSNH